MMVRGGLLLVLLLVLGEGEGRGQDWRAPPMREGAGRSSDDVVLDLALAPTDHSLVASWRLANPSGQVGSIMVSWSDSSTPCYVGPTTTSSDSCSAPLPPCTLSTVQVQPLDVGDNPVGVSASNSAYTLMEDDSLVPMCSLDEAGSIDVQWTSPGDCVTSYNVSWTGDILWQTGEFPETGMASTLNEHFTFSSTTAYTEYLVTVTDGGSQRGREGPREEEDRGKGQGERQGRSSCSVITPEAAPSAPRAVEVTPTAATELTVSWLPPSLLNGVIKGYSVTWQGQDGVTGKVKVAGDDHGIIVAGLTSCRTYEVTVTASTSAGEGPSSLPISESTECLCTNLEVVNLFSPTSDANSIALLWGRPETSCVVTGYLISYTGEDLGGNGLTDSGDRSIPMENSVDQINYNLDGLQAGFEYSVSVRVDSDQSPPSTIDGIQTLPDAASAPENF